MPEFLCWFCPMTSTFSQPQFLISKKSLQFPHSSKILLGTHGLKLNSVISTFSIKLIFWSLHLFLKYWVIESFLQQYLQSLPFTLNGL